MNSVLDKKIESRSPSVWRPWSLHDGARPTRIIDRRIPAAGSCLPATALEQGFWERHVDGQWTAYPWPLCAILEQAYCCHRETVTVPCGSDSTGLGWSTPSRVDLQTPFAQASQDFHRARQVNTKTGCECEVRRWPCSQHPAAQRMKTDEAKKLAEQERKRQEALKAKMEEERRFNNRWAAWASWNADWVWLILDDAEWQKVQGGDAPTASAPARQPYALGACSKEGWWPEVVRNWPTENVSSAAHPFQRACSFAVQCLSPGAGCCSEALAREWTVLANLWQASGQGDSSQLVGAYRIQSRGLLQSFAGTRQAMLARLGAEEFSDSIDRLSQLQVNLMWHGTRSVDGLLDICNHGFDRAMAKTCAFGKGCYFAKSAAYSDKFACDVKVPNEARPLRAMLLAGVLVGELAQGSSGMYPPPVKAHSRTGLRYENTCDSPDSPKIVVTYQDGQAVPLYIMVYTRAK